MTDASRDASQPSWPRQAAHTAWDGLLGILYPPRCVGCGARQPEETQPLCHRCLQRLERATETHVDAVLARLPEAHGVLDGAFALWLFDAGATVQRVQHLLKYGNRPHLGLALGQLMGTIYPATLPPPDLVLPIPLHRVRLYERGYNQSAMLARGVGHTLGVPVSEKALIRHRATRSQTNLSRRRRWENVSEAFLLGIPEAVTGRRILLIDDVLTTGATLAAAAALLQQAGASSIHAATLALAR